ncbi:MAG TPA: DNA repair protein RadC [Anaeromyxobacteraceae bacterium]
MTADARPPNGEPSERPRERLLAEGPRALSDADLLALILGTGTGRLSARAAALSLAEAMPVGELAWAPAEALSGLPGIGPARAAAIAAAFELGRRGAWAPPRRGERCLDPARVHELMRHAAHAERECFHVVLLDVRGRLIRAVQVAEGSLTQCPVSPRDALRPAVREGAHGVVFVHNHPSGDPSPSPEDLDLTERLRAAAEVVGVMARDHVVVAAGGYFSFVEAGRWRR